MDRQMEPESMKLITDQIVRGVQPRRADPENHWEAGMEQDVKKQIVVE